MLIAQHNRMSHNTMPIAYPRSKFGTGKNFTENNIFRQKGTVDIILHRLPSPYVPRHEYHSETLLGFVQSLLHHPSNKAYHNRFTTHRASELQLGTLDLVSKNVEVLDEIQQSPHL